MRDGPALPPKPEPAQSFAETLAAARNGAAVRIGELLETCRPYLLAIALAELPTELHGKLGASDIVQETLVRGMQGFGEFQGRSSEELARWLRKILLNHLANEVKRYRTEKRQVDRERPADSKLADARQPSPSGAALSREEWDRLASAIARLPEEMQRVIHWRHRDNLSFAEIGERLGKSEDAAGKVWAKALERLQRELRTRS